MTKTSVDDLSEMAMWATKGDHDCMHGANDAQSPMEYRSMRK